MFGSVGPNTSGKPLHDGSGFCRSGMLNVDTDDTDEPRDDARTIVESEGADSSSLAAAGLFALGSAALLVQAIHFKP